jgi:hypothetical protein
MGMLTRGQPAISVFRSNVALSRRERRQFPTDRHRPMKIASNRSWLRFRTSRATSAAIVASCVVRRGAVAALAAGLALGGCASSSPSAPSGHATAQELLGLNNMTPASGTGLRELSPAEKEVITHAVGLSVSNPGSAQYRWPQISSSEEGSVNYCGMVNAKSPFPAYSGWQAYIVEATVSGGRISSAVVGLIAGGKDTEIVRKMCTKYGLDPGGGGGPG